MKRKPWTDEDDAQLAEFYRDGVNSVEMAATLGRSRGSIHGRAMKLGLSTPAQRGDQNPVWIAIKQLCKDGEGRTVRELAVATGAKEKNVERLMYVRREMGHAHIVDFDPVLRGTSTPLWLPEPGEDAQRPALSEEAMARKLRRNRRVADDPDLTPDLPISRKSSPAPRLIGGAQHELVRALYGMGAPA